MSIIFAGMNKIAQLKTPLRPKSQKLLSVLKVKAAFRPVLIRDLSLGQDLSARRRRCGCKFHYLYVSTDEVVGKHIRVMTWRPELPDMFTAPTPIAADAPVRLRVEVDYERLRFAFRVGGGDWQWLPEQFDASILSGEAGTPGPPNFTGAFVGMRCQVYAGTGLSG